MDITKPPPAFCEELMIKAQDFHGPEVDDFHHREVYTAILPGNVLSGFGSSIGLYDEVWVHWLPTREYPQPDDIRLAEMLPSFAAICAGIVHALREYTIEWNVERVRQEIQESLSNEDWLLFLQDGYAPFVAIDRIYINPTARVVSCICDCSIDSTIEEHGLIVIMVDGVWSAKWAMEEAEYFSDWKDGLTK